MPIDPLGSSEGLDPRKPVAGLDPLNPDPNAPGPFARGVKSGVAGVKSSLYGAGALAARGATAALPAAAAPFTQGLEAAALENVKAQNEIAAAGSMGYEDVLADPTRSAEYFKYLLGQAVPSLAMMAVGGGLGALAGRAVAGQAGVAAARAVGAVTPAVRAGALTGAIIPDVAMEVGSIYPEALETGVESPGARALAGGAVAGALDFVPLLAAEKYLKPIGKGGVGALARGAVKGAPVGAALEGSQEMLQSMVERAAAGKSLTDPAAVSDYIESFLGGAAPGSVFGAAIGARRQSAAPVQETPPFTGSEQPPIVNAPDLGMVDPGLGSLQNVGTSEQVPTVTQQENGNIPSVSVPALHAAAAEQLAALEPELVAAQQAHDALVARRKELDVESKLEPGQRRIGKEITIEKRAVTDQIKVARSKIEEVGGQLNAARTQVATLAAQLDPVAGVVGAVPTPAEATRGAANVPEVVQPPGAGVAPVIQPTLEQQTARAVEGARVAAGETPSIVGTKTVSAQEIGQVTPIGQLRDSIATVLADKKIPDTKKVEYATHIDSVIDKAISKLPSIPEDIRPERVRRMVFKSIGFRLPADAKNDIVETILKTQFSKGAIGDLTGLPPISQKERGEWSNLEQGDLEQKLSQSQYEKLLWFRARDAEERKPKFSKGAIELPKENLGAAFGYYDPSTGKTYVRDDLPPTVKRFVAAHEEHHSTQSDQFRADHPFLAEVAATAFPGFKDPVGMMATIAASLSPKRLKFYVDRLRGETPSINIPVESNAALTQDEFDTLPEPAKFAAVDEFNRVMREKGTRLRTHLAQLLGNRPELVVKTFMATPGSPIGSYTRVGPLKAVISLALNAKSELGVADHEGFHYAEDWLLDARERRIVANAIKPGRPVFESLMQKVRAYDIANQTNLADEVAGVPAEARAYAFEFWRRGELQADGVLSTTWQKIRNFLEKIVNFVNGEGFTSMEDIFKALDLGQFAERQAGTQMGELVIPLERNGEKLDAIRGAETQFSRAAVAQMNTRMEAGELERTQVQQAFLAIQDNAQIPAPSFQFATGLAKAEVGGLKDWWFKHIATPNYVSRFSDGYKNVMQTLNTYIRYRKILAEQMLREKLPSWYKAPDDDRRAAFGVMLTRTVEGYSKDSAELAALLEPLTIEQRKLYDQATGMIEGFLRAQFAKDQVSRRTQLTSPGAYEKWETERRAQVDSLIDKGYVPLRRYGDYSVRVYMETPDGKRIDGGLMFVDTARGQHTIATMYREEIARSGANLKVEIGTRDKNQRDTSISIEQFLGTLRRQGIEISQTERERLVLALTNSESMTRNKMMHREGLPGYSEDSMRVLHEFGVNMSGELAYARFADAIDAATEGRAVAADVNSINSEPEIKIDEPAKNPDGTWAETADEYKARNLWKDGDPMSGFYKGLSTELSNYVLVPDHTGGWSKRLRAAAMVYFIGGSLSAGVVNAMSVPMLVVPELSLHTGYGNSLATTMGAWKDAWRYYHILHDMEKLKSDDPQYAIPGIDKNLRLAIAAAADHIFDTEIHQMLGMSQGTVYSKSRNVQRAMEAWMSPFRVSEQANRLASFIAAYRVATTGEGVKGRGRLYGQELFKFASGIVDATQNSYNESNRPGAARHPVFAMMFMFKSFPLFMIEAISLMYKQNPRSAVYMLLGLTMMTGVQGLPFAETLLDLIDTIAQRIFNSPFNSRRAMRNVIKAGSEAMVGADLSDVVLRGVLNDVLGVSMASRIGTGDFVPGTRLGAADADSGRVLAEMLGAPFAMVKDAAASVGKFTGGVFTGDWKEVADAIRAGGPIAMRNLVKGAEQLNSGFAMDARGRKIVDVNTIDGLLQLGGLSSAKVAKMYDMETINIQTKAFHTQFSQELQSHLIAAMKDGDTAKVQEVNDLRNEWNRENPSMPILANAASVRRAIILSGVPLDQRSRLLWGRRIRGANVFSEEENE